jgi:hypothetical protein
MGNRIFMAVVFLLWLSTMSWLMVARILPPFFYGEPPSRGFLVDDGPVCWEIRCGDRPIGYAVSQAVPGALGTTEIHSRVLLENVRLQEMAPQWLSGLVDSVGEIRLDTRSRLTLDSLGNLASFETKMQLNDLPLAVKMRGRVEGPELVLTIHSNDVVHEARYPMPANALLASELIPESKLLPVYVGRRWQQEVFSPFRPPNDSLELLQAEVVEEGTIDHHGQRCRARKIEYRTLLTPGVAADDALRAVVWVADDGTVLRQEVRFMSVRLRFERCNEPEMLEMAERLLDLDSVATLSTPAPSP